MIPRVKKSGKTVFGVRIGLHEPMLTVYVPVYLGLFGDTYCQAFNRCCLKAVSMSFTFVSMLPRYAKVFDGRKA